MVFDDASWDTLFNDSFDKFVQGLEKEFRENAEYRKEVLRYERKRELKKLKKRRKDQRKKVMKIRRQTWIAFRIFVMIFRSDIVTLDTLDIEFKNYKHANPSPISLEKTFVPRNKKKKNLHLCYEYRKLEHG
ncbi:hypothetical protein CRE_18109 [Caenorhabditis remanei]|uniref:Uncharacterized protein n=1 Tax=Caenorhabditis remanei TaxID=31234 RepID=E3N347_CAERE|nr:hypothetical protein CRE_18109 [Caenorhabditis remanei]